MSIASIESVCVYCGSSAHADENFKKAADDLGTTLAENNVKVVYGGGRSGLMGIVADAALREGGQVHGIIPEYLADKEVSHDDLTQLDIVDSMHVRKQAMVDNSDAFIVLPGGLGTLDEFFEIMTWRQLGIHSKPIVVVNVDGFWSNLVKLVEHLIETKFALQQDRDNLIVIDDVSQIVEALRNAPPPGANPQSKWI